MSDRVGLILPFHILAGLLGLVAGAVALYAWKGANLHRKSGLIFVYAMGFLGATGTIIAALKHQRLNAMQGLFTVYLVITALLTVRPPDRKSYWIGRGALLGVFALFLAYVRFGLAAASSPKGMFDGYPTALYVIFGAVALLAMLGDLRVLSGRAIDGPRRLARHLWRMCFAMFIATGSFFLGQAKVFPEPIRIMPLLATPVVASILILFYWLWRVRIRGSFRWAD